MRFNTLASWLDWQSGLNLKEIDLGLDRVGAVWKTLSRGRSLPPVITVAGTNGKGSSVAMLESIYLASGYTTCVYTSPHLVHYNERVRLSGDMASDEQLMQAFERIDHARDGKPLTYFEYGTLSALLISLDEQPDVVILEVGLGGRLDAVNIVDADVALITSVDLDHTEWLGDTREAVAVEKAGVMRAGAPCVYASDNMPGSIASEAERMGASLRKAGTDFRFERGSDDWHWFSSTKSITGLPHPTLKGAHQYQNAAGVLEVIALLGDRLPVANGAVRSGLVDARAGGRFQLVRSGNDWVLDVAHNPAAVLTLKQNLQAMETAGLRVAVFTALKDKAVAEIVAIMAPLIDRWLIIGSQGERGQSGEQILTAVQDVIGSVSTVVDHDYGQAFSRARQLAGETGLVVCFGSFQLVGAAMSYLGKDAR